MVHIEFTTDELNVLANALAAQPFRDVAAIMGKLQQAYSKFVNVDPTTEEEV